MAETVKTTKPAEPKLYTLGRDFWSGKKLIRRGEQLYFSEGQAPKTAALVEAEEEPEMEEPSTDDKKKSDK